MLNEKHEIAKLLKVPVAGAALTIAIKEFQKRAGIPQTGVPSPKMWEILAGDHKSKIVPINKIDDPKEDLDDDDQATEPAKVSENLPTCASILELYALFANTDWDAVMKKRNIKEVFYHCTATRQDATFTALQNGWRARGWKNDGYHICVNAAGDWILFVPFENVSNGVGGRNSGALNMSYIGGINKNGRAEDNRTPEQIEFHKHFHYLVKKHLPKAEERGHNEVAAKACPSYNLKNWLKTLNS
jgi:N-acetylmuramoyl-L-alanine amidase